MVKRARGAPAGGGSAPEPAKKRVKKPRQRKKQKKEAAAEDETGSAALGDESGAGAAQPANDQGAEGAAAAASESGSVARDNVEGGALVGDGSKQEAASGASRVAQTAEDAAGGEGSSATTSQKRNVSANLILSKGVVRRIVKLDPDVKMVSLDAIFLIAKSAETFVGELAKKAGDASEARTREELLTKANGEPSLSESDLASLTQQAKDADRWIRYDDVYTAVQQAIHQGRDWSFLQKLITAPHFGLVDEDW
eukprot:g3639.t1